MRKDLESQGSKSFFAYFPVFDVDGTILNIPSRGYRESGKMETAVPAKWKPVLSPL